MPYVLHIGTDGVFLARAGIKCDRWKYLLYHDAMYSDAGAEKDGSVKGKNFVFTSLACLRKIW